MLKNCPSVKTASVEKLLSLWVQRYTPDLSSVFAENSLSYSSLLEAGSAEGRTLTATKLKDKILDVNCQMAWIQTKTLYAYIPNLLDLKEAKRITQFAFRVYRKLLEIYQQQSISIISPTSEAEITALSSWRTEAIEELAYALEPILMVFQEQHLISKDWRCLGFMTTQINFTNKLILKKLTDGEKILLTPYLRFIEEQVSIPWQRLCVAAAKYELGSPKLTLVEQMLPLSVEIAEAVYRRLVELLPDHRSRRGTLTDPGITHSCLRDLSMFQGYLWLCFLQDSLDPIQAELLPLCVMVTQGVGIKREMIENWCQELAREIETRVNHEQKLLLQPYTKALQEIFYQEFRNLKVGEEEEVRG